MSTYFWPLTPVSVVGSATEATQLQVLAELQDINSNTSDVATATKQDSQIALETSIATNTANTTLNVAALLDITHNVGDPGQPLKMALIAGTDGTDTYPILTDAGGRLNISVNDSALPTGAATEATLAILNGNAEDIEQALTSVAQESTLQNINDNITSIMENGLPAVVPSFAQLNDDGLIDTSSTNIPASSSAPLEIVASLSANIKVIQSVEDIGEFIAVYQGAALSEQLVGVLPLGGGELNVSLATGTRVSIRNMKNAAINNGSIVFNFLG